MAGKVKKCLADSGYSKEYGSGMTAVKNEHRGKIRVQNPRSLEGSMDIDKACQKSEPGAARWDYLVVVSKSWNENLALIEVHGAARGGEVDVVIKKKEWLIKWLSRTRLNRFKKQFFWVSTGSIKITAQSKYGKKLAAKRIPLPRKVTPLLDTEAEYNQ
jgi:hypothetical protein